MPTEYEDRHEFWAKLHRERVERRARDLELYGPGYQKRRERMHDLFTGKSLLRAADRISQMVQGAFKQTDALFDVLSEKLGTKVIEIDRTKEPEFDLNPKELYARDHTAPIANAEFLQAIEDAIKSLYGNEQLPATLTQGTSTAVQAASAELTAPLEPRGMALELPGARVAIIHGFDSFEEILAKVEYGFPENELPELLNMLRTQREGVEEVSDAFARQLFYRASVRFVERSMDPEFADGPERDRLLYFALAIKGLRPDIDQDDTFDKIYDGVYEHLQKQKAAGREFAGTVDKLNVISMFDKVRERHVKEAMHASTHELGGTEQDDTIAPIITDEAEAARRLQEGLAQIPESEGGTQPNKVVPFRPVVKPRGPEGEEPGGQ
ncbi:MAG: hypothetical protein SFW65_04130 [Alphaproteobacteria bacterium]|nr:hypothetical protein [Alphaproteobacteria bacterium]